jgi:hypothetical protein
MPCASRRDGISCRGTPSHHGGYGGVGAAGQQLDALLIVQLSELTPGVALPLIEPPAHQAQHACMTSCR